KTALNDPHSVVISEDLAKKYFGQNNALGQRLELNQGDQFEPFVVTGVAKRSPQNSSIQIRMLVPMQSRQMSSSDSTWSNFFLNTFVLLKPNTDPENVVAKFATVYNSEAAGEVKEMAEKYGFKDKTQY